MTIREMIDAMLAGKTLVFLNGATAYYDPDDETCGPWVYVGASKSRMSNGWHCKDWSIKPELKKRLMTRNEAIGFCLYTRGIVVRCEDAEAWESGLAFGFTTGIDCYKWAIMDIKGRIIDGPYKFEVEE